MEIILLALLVFLLSTFGNVFAVIPDILRESEDEFLKFFENNQFEPTLPDDPKTYCERYEYVLVHTYTTRGYKENKITLSKKVKNCKIQFPLINHTEIEMDCIYCGLEATYDYQKAARNGRRKFHDKYEDVSEPRDGPQTRTFEFFVSKSTIAKDANDYINAYIFGPVDVPNEIDVTNGTGDAYYKNQIIWTESTRCWGCISNKLADGTKPLKIIDQAIPKKPNGNY